LNEQVTRVRVILDNQHGAARKGGVAPRLNALRRRAHATMLHLHVWRAKQCRPLPLTSETVSATVVAHDPPQHPYRRASPRVSRGCRGQARSSRPPTSHKGDPRLLANSSTRRPLEFMNRDDATTRDSACSRMAAWNAPSKSPGRRTSSDWMWIPRRRAVASGCDTRRRDDRGSRAPQHP
jgi:hypothetical protein